MTRMNKTATARTPGRRNVDTRSPAISQAYASGLADWAKANGYVSADGSPLVYSSRDRRMVERARAAANR